MLDEITLPDGTTRRLGNLVTLAGPSLDLPTFGDTPAAKVIPRGEWDDLLKAYDDSLSDPFLPPVADQNGVGQCNCSATASMCEYLRNRQGLAYTQLSAADLYHRINGGSDRGSLLEDAIREVMTRGIGTVATSGYLWKRGEWKGEASGTERARFRVTEAYLCPSFDHCYSAVLQGFALNSGVMWYDSYTPDADGWLPRGRGGAGGHAIMGYRPMKRAGVYGIAHQNSWGTGWGKRGLFVIPETAYSGPVGGWFAVRAITDEGGVIPQEQ